MHNNLFFLEVAFTSLVVLAALGAGAVALLVVSRLFFVKR